MILSIFLIVFFSYLSVKKREFATNMMICQSVCHFSIFHERLFTTSQGSEKISFAFLLVISTSIPVDFFLLSSRAMNILYICTGNVFRSMSAEYLTKKYIMDNHLSHLIVSSAWTVANPEVPFSETIERLVFYGCDASHHLQRRISPEILWAQDLIICMAEHHRQSIRSLWYDAVLFNEIAYGISKDVLDDTEYMQQYWSETFDISSYVPIIVDYLHNAIPIIVRKLSTRG